MGRAALPRRPPDCVPFLSLRGVSSFVRSLFGSRGENRKPLTLTSRNFLSEAS